MKKTIILLALALLGVSALSFAMGDNGGAVYDGEFLVLKGQIVRIEARNITRVLVVEKDTLTVVKADPSYVELMGAKEGQTLVELYTDKGKQSYKVTVEAHDIDELLGQIRDLIHNQIGLSDIKVSKNTLTNRINLEGEANKEDLAKIKTMLGPMGTYVDNFLKEKVSQDVVEIDVEILEINSDAAQTMGVNLPTSFVFGEPNSTIVGGSTGGGTETPLTNQKGIKPFYNLFQSYTRSSLGAAISFLIQENKAKILSKPRLACLSGKEADLMVGGQVPTITTGVISGGGSSNSISYQDYGIKLKVSPVVRDSGKIEINLNTEVSDVGQSYTLGTETNPTALATTLNKRSTSTTILLDDSQTMSISGLIAQKNQESLSKFPWLSDIPVLGAFFRSKSTTAGGGNGAGGDMELVIMLTPHVIKSDKPKEDLTYAAKVQALPLNAGLVKDNSDYSSQVIVYTQEVRDKIINTLAYPYDAQEAGWQANVTVKLHLASDGSLIEAKMEQGSGYKIFDEAVMKTIHEMSKYPAFPSNIDAKDLWLEIPIVYQMK